MNPTDLIIQHRRPTVEELEYQHRGYVIKLASQYSTDYDERQDLQQEGLLGILDAAKYYDPSRGTSFLGFAHKWIDGRMKKFLIRQMKAKGMKGRNGTLLKSPPKFTNNEQAIYGISQGSEDMVEQQRQTIVGERLLKDFTSTLNKHYQVFYRRRYIEQRKLRELGSTAKVKEQNIKRWIKKFAVSRAEVMEYRCCPL